MSPRIELVALGLLTACETHPAVWPLALDTAIEDTEAADADLAVGLSGLDRNDAQQRVE